MAIFGKLRQNRKSSSTFYKADAVVIPTQDTCSSSYIAIHPNTEQQRALEELQLRALQQQVIAQLGQQALSGVEITLLLEEAVQQVKVLLGADYCAIFELFPQISQCRIWAGAGWPEKPQSYRLYAMHWQDRQLVIPELLDSLSIVSGVSLPLGSEGEAVLNLYTTQMRSFSEEDLHFLQTVTTILSSAMVQRQMEKNLAQALDLAEAANERKRQFLANMSHELRTPLNAIIGYSDMLAHGMGANDPRKEQKYLENILKSGHHLLNMVNDILDLSYAEAGTINLHKEKVNLSEVVAELERRFQPKAKLQKIDLAFRISPDLGYGMLDSERLQQILGNLISNALKFNQPGGTVTVDLQRLHKKEGEPQWLVGEVADTGIGISKQSMEELFQEFHQIDNSAARVQGGAGLGLALTKHLIKLHGGNIEVESNLGQGTCFTFKLPL